MKTNNNVIDIDGILFLQQKDRAQEQFAYLSGEKNVSKNVIKKFNKNIKKNLEISSKQGFKYKHIVFPAKAIAFKELFSVYNIKIQSIYEQFNISEFDDYILYPRVSPSDYFSTDTHNSDIGKLRLITEILKPLGYDISKYTPFFESSYIYGDLSKMINGKKEKAKDFKFFSENPFNCIEAFSTHKALKGNSGHIDYHLNGNALFNDRLVLFGDSFFRTALHIYNKIFKEVIYFRTPFILEDVSRLLNPDIVLTGNAERYLVDPPAYNQSPPYFIHFISFQIITIVNF